jgi:predicted acyl esterase
VFAADLSTIVIIIVLLIAIKWPPAKQSAIHLLKWPPKSSEPFGQYFHSGSSAHPAGGALDTLPSTGNEVPDTFIYDPKNPVPTIGGSICCTGNSKDRPGSFEQRRLESRSDILISTSEVLSQNLTLVGSFEAVLYIS